MKRIMMLLLIYGNYLTLMGQVDSVNVTMKDPTRSVRLIDTIRIDEKRVSGVDSLELTLNYLKEVYRDDVQWINPDDSLRLAIGRIIDHIEDGPIGPALNFLRAYPFELLEDPSATVKPEDVSVGVPGDALPSPSIQDTLKLDSLTVEIDSIRFPSLDTVRIEMTDSTRLIFQETLLFEVRDTSLKPLRDFSKIGSGDSLRSSVDLLLKSIEDDSLQIWLKNLTDDSTSIWLSNETAYKRFWLKNEVYDSIGIWIENDHKNSLKLIVDDGIYFRRMGRSKKIEDYLTEQRVIESDLQKMKPVVIKPQIWNYGGLGSMNLAQGYLSNWAPGGESSISTFAEINLFANYSKNNTKWDNTMRFKYGLIKSGDKRLTKNEDLLEINSKFGQKAFGNLGQRAIEKYGTEGIKDWYYSLLVSFKSQFARGYNYPNDSVVVSRFMAPGYMMFALGLDYKPSKKISILISPITSKFTFVLDTALIDQTKYGVSPDKTVYHEIGAYIKTRLLYDFSDDISVENKLDLFTNYSHNPQNIDIDWEVIVRMKITYYLSATISAHLIYDDDVHVPIFNSEGVKIGAGPRMQFKELLNLGFSYKF